MPLIEEGMLSIWKVTGFRREAPLAMVSQLKELKVYFTNLPLEKTLSQDGLS